MMHSSTHSLMTLKDVQPGDHLCCIYETEEELRAVITPFLRQGLEQHEKVIYIVDARPAETVLQYLQDTFTTSSGQAPNINACVSQGQFTILPSGETYLRDGKFDPERMICLLQKETEQALAEGYSALRVTGEMSWASRELPGAERLIEYETKLNEFFPNSRCVGICQYDRRRFEPEILLDILRTHPVALIGSEIYENFYYIPPEELLGENLSTPKLQHWIDNLIEHKRIDEELNSYQEHLEELVQDRTLELAATNEQLQQEINQRQRAEAELRLHSDMMKNMSEGINLVRASDGVILYTNPKFEQMFGYEPDEMLGKPISIVNAPLEQSSEETAQEVMESLKTDGTWQGDIHNIRKDGAPFWCHANVSWIEYPGYERALISVHTDITEHKQVEEALRESEARFRRIVENNEAGYFYIDRDGCFQDVNEAWLRMHKYSSQNEVIGQHFALTQVETDLEQARKNVTRLLSGEPIPKGEFSRRCKDGSVGYHMFSASPVRKHEEIIGLEGFLVDITDRKQIEEEIKLNESLLEGLLALNQKMDVSLHEITDFILEQSITLTKSKIGFIGFMNDDESLCTIHAWSQSAMKRCAVKDRNPDFIIAESGIWGECVRQRKPFLLNEYVAPHSLKKGIPDCHIALSRFLAVPIFDADRIVAVIAVGNKVSEYTTSDIRQLTLLGNGMVRVIQRQQVQKELRRARNSAEAASQAKSEFLANISHELRTPLNGILGYTQILRRDEQLSDWQRTRLASIERNGQHLLILINDILDLAKIEAGRLELKPAVFPLPQFLRNLAEMFVFKARGKKIDFLSDIASDLPPAVYCDEVRLRQILLNLLGNAIKFTDQGKVTLKVSRRQKTEGRKQVERINEESDTANCQLPTADLSFEIEDTGCGISPEQLDTIFYPFEQRSEKHAQIEGAGLGLSISQQLAETMGSRIQVQSTVGQGSVFWFDVDFPEAEAEIMISAKSSPRIIGFKGEDRKVLLVDDAPGNVDLLEEILSPLGFKTEIAGDGRNAIEKAKTFLPDLILMDLKLPGMDGLEAIRHIHQLSGLEHINVIAVSASVNEMRKQKSLAEGCNAFISKPFQITSLLDTIRKVLKLEWITEQESFPLIDEREKTMPVLPPFAELQELLGLAEQGMVLKIRQWVERIEQLDAKYIPFTRKIRLLNQEFQCEEICELLNNVISR